MAWQVHLVHVLAMAVLVGGGTVASMNRTGRGTEVAWWTAYAAIVVTGVGNIGALGTGLPGPATLWGGLLLAKLVLVLALGLVGLQRSVIIHARGSARGHWYASAGLAAVIASLGVWLAHA